ncbi:MAG: metallophosphoesterase family protein [Cellulosilyticaceae bacterium]
MRIGVISDTHGVLRDEVIQILQTCEVIFHGGDIGDMAILEKLREIAPVYVVRGNNDKECWCEEIEEKVRVELEGVRVLMIHDRKMIRKRDDLDEVDMVICGHSHKYSDTLEDGIRYLNPGSCGRRRFSLPLTMMVVEIKHKEMIRIEEINLIMS